VTEEFDDLPVGDPADPLARLVAELRLEADQSRFEHLTTVAMAEIQDPPTVRRWSRQAVAAIAATVAVVVAFSGAAVAAQGAGPGDLLYPLDQALEVVGVGDGGASERLDEARSLAEQNRFDRGLRHAADVLSDDPEAQRAVSAAANRVVDVEPDSLGADVTNLLDYLAANLGSVDGRTVADMAQQIGSGGPEVGPQDDVPGGGPPADVPGVGPQDDVPGEGRPADVPGGGPPADVPGGGRPG
jgi:hypothetical protein